MSMAEQESGTGTVTLGLERWVQFAFVAAAGLGIWLSNNIIEAVWLMIAENWNAVPMPDDLLVSASAVIVAVLGAWICYRNPRIHKWASEVASELSKVTWPTRRETWSATVVVLIVSIIAAAILGVFDAAWSAVTDLIYKV